MQPTTRSAEARLERARETSFDAVEDLAATETTAFEGVPENEAELADDLDIDVDLQAEDHLPLEHDPEKCVVVVEEDPPITS